MGRPPCCDKASVKRGLWTAEEDAKILAYVANNGTGNWTLVPKKAGLNRCGKSCRLRWTNYLRPDLKHESFSPQEEDLIIELHKAIGSRWSLIAKQLPGRTDNDVKNYWNTKLKKKLKKMGIDPVTHKPFSQIISDYGNISSITLPHFKPHFQPTNRRSSLSIHPPLFEYQASMQSITPPLPLATLSSSSSSCSSSYQIGTMMPMAALSQTPSNIDFIGPYLFDQLSPASSSSSSSSSSITTISSSSQSKVSQTSPYPIMPSSPSCWSNLIIATSETEKPPQVEENHPDYEFFNSVGGYGGDGVEEHKKSDDRNTLEGGPIIDPSSSPLNSFVKSILDRDSEMKLDFLALEEFLDY